MLHARNTTTPGGAHSDVGWRSSHMRHRERNVQMVSAGGPDHLYVTRNVQMVDSGPDHLYITRNAQMVVSGKLDHL